MHQFTIIPVKHRTLGANEIGPTFFVNEAQFFTGTRLVVDEQLIMPAPFKNVSVVHPPRLNTGTEVDLTLTHFTNVSTFGSNEVDESPPDGVLRLAIFTNGQSFGAQELDVAPADGILRMTVFSNTSTFGSDVVVVDDSGTADEDPMIGGGPIGDDVI